MNFVCPWQVRKSSIKPPGGLFNFGPWERGLIKEGGLKDRRGGGGGEAGLISNHRIIFNKLDSEQCLSLLRDSSGIRTCECAGDSQKVDQQEPTGRRGGVSGDTSSHQLTIGQLRQGCWYSTVGLSVSTYFVAGSDWYWANRSVNSLEEHRILCWVDTHRRCGKVYQGLRSDTVQCPWQSLWIHSWNKQICGKYKSKRWWLVHYFAVFNQASCLNKRQIPISHVHLLKNNE